VHAQFKQVINVYLKLIQRNALRLSLKLATNNVLNQQRKERTDALNLEKTSVRKETPNVTQLLLKNAKKAVKKIHKVVRTTKKVHTKRTCKSRSFKKCGAKVEGKECRKSYVSGCHKKHAEKKHKKAIKKTIHRHSKKIARAVCKGLKGCEKLECQEKVHKHAKKHFKRVKKTQPQSIEKMFMQSFRK